MTSLLIVSLSFIEPSAVAESKLKIIKPVALHVGDTVGLVSSASRVFPDEDIEAAILRLKALGFKVIVGKSVYLKQGYYAGTEKQRANDINEMFENPAIKGIFEARGGLGCAQILPYLNYAMIQKNPKVLMGFSDITALLLAIHKKTGLVTFHGTLAAYPWPEFTVDYLKKVLFAANKEQFKNPTDVDSSKDIINSKYRTISIRGGKASGPLLGGNLTLLTSMVGTPFQPDFKGAILFVEETNENFRHIDRMMQQLKAAGVLDQISGFVFGTCKGCAISIGGENAEYSSLTLMQILDQYIKPLNIPAYSGAMIGHQTKMFTLPEGVKVTINADDGTITMDEAAVIEKEH